MKRLILETNDTGAESIRQAGLADFVIGFDPRFVWGPLASQAELATLLEDRSPKHDLIGGHWLDYLDRRLFADTTQADLVATENPAISVLDHRDRTSRILGNAGCDRHSETNMTRLILTTSDSGAGGLRKAGGADIVLPFGLLFVWGPLPSDQELATLLGLRSANQGLAVPEGLENSIRRHLGANLPKDFELAEFCERCETVELWIDPVPNAQLMLIWLLDYFQSCRKAVSKLTLLQADYVIGDTPPEDLAKRRPHATRITNDHLEAACMAWQAYRAPTPRDWVNLLARDLSVLPQLRITVLGLLDELPSSATGLGATETRILELISAGHMHPFDLLPGHMRRNERRVFGYWKIGSLLDRLAHCPIPAVSGLDDGPFTEELHRVRERHERYKQSRLSLTTLGEAVLNRTDDFSRHNPIHRWLGGTELTNDRLWRWDLANLILLTP